MRVTVALFALLRERAGARELELDLPEGARVGDALDALAAVVGDVPVVLAVNRRYADRDERLSDRDEIALIPPVSGGGIAAGEIAVEIVDAPLSSDAALAAVRDPRAGAVVLFAGVTREVRQLEYEAYEAMARERMARIARDALAAHGACRVAVTHRIGVVPLGEPSVLVAVSAPHRDEAFAAARAIIDAIKEQVPIWKREVQGEQRNWVAGHPVAPD